MILVFNSKTEEKKKEKKKKEEKKKKKKEVAISFLKDESWSW